MLEETRKAFREAARNDPNPAIRQYARLMLRGEASPRRERRRRRRRKIAAAE